ncbi:acyltransferase family protein [Massilia sp. CF038]|uniref:acyltransferase family protein n=1 Tax=Massilia sp. CF038 TaxID=1881045 RepID=UPI0009221686|nr:acyltransferase family protein [Massilia sp. CF038]SHG56733.1 Acyltransferase family protein [Massilia sp. CF038]
MQTPQTRLFFLDWVRIIAFMLLIVYHVGMYYVTWGWHVKSPFASDAIEPFMLLSSPWRLSLLFLISGVASSFMLSKIGAGRFVRQRSVRLLVPLIFGMLVIVPPQPYFEVIEKFAYQGSYADFMRLYLSAFHGFCKEQECLTLPTWNHLWFVAYLWVYTLLLGAIVVLAGTRFDRVAARVCGALTGWKLIVLPALVLGALRIALSSQFPITHNLTWDWYNHANSLCAFVLGAMFARSQGVWQQMEGARWHALGLAVSSWGALIIYYSLFDTEALRPALEEWRMLMRVVYMLCAWSAIVAVCGFAKRHLNRDSASRAYLTEAVFPVYILHQTLIVSMAHLIKPAKIAAGTEGLILIVLTLCISFGSFEIIRRIAVLRPLFGLAWRRPSPQKDGLESKQPATASC